MGGEGRGGARRGERIHLFLAFVIWPLTTQTFRDGAPFLLLVETPPTVGLSLRASHRKHLLVFHPLSASLPVAATYLLPGRR